jgi:hypothetical protein
MRDGPWCGAAPVPEPEGVRTNGFALSTRGVASGVVLRDCSDGQVCASE